MMPATAAIAIAATTAVHGTAHEPTIKPATAAIAAWAT
jgi:hypothetical protein